jgi:hypothetical protein
MFQQIPSAYPTYSKNFDPLRKLDDDKITNIIPGKNFDDGSIISIGTLPNFSPFHFISESDSLIPPTMLKIKPYSFPFGNYGEYTVIVPSDIFIPNFKMTYDQQMFSPYYKDVCDTKDLRETISKKLYYKFLDKWLYDEDKSKYLLGYFKHADGEIKLVKDADKKDDYNSNSQEIIDKKVAFIEKNIFRLEDMYIILKKFIYGTQISWCNLIQNSYIIREAIEKTLERKIEKLISAQK